jgi:DNA-binding NarL/FixJ family response regulator
MQTLGSIRVLLALDGLAGDLLESRLREDADFELVGRAGEDDVLEVARRTQPDFVVLPLPEAGARCDAADLFAAVSKVKVLTLEKTAGQAYLSELIGDVSPAELADALRRAVARGGL